MDKQYILTCIDELLSGKSENAFFNLLELGPEAIPFIHDAYLGSADAESKVRLLRVASETHTEQAIGLMRIGLDDAAPSVWKEALNGCVRIGGPNAKNALCESLKSEARGDMSDTYKEWAIEAIE